MKHLLPTQVHVAACGRQLVCAADSLWRVSKPAMLYIVQLCTTGNSTRTDICCNFNFVCRSQQLCMQKALNLKGVLDVRADVHVCLVRSAQASWERGPWTPGARLPPAAFQQKFLLRVLTGGAQGSRWRIAAQLKVLPIDPLLWVNGYDTWWSG